MNAHSKVMNAHSKVMNETFYYAKIQLYPILNKTFTEYLHFFIHNSLFFAPFSLHIPNNSANFVVRLQAKGQRIANQRSKDCKQKTKKKTKIRHSYEYEDNSNQRLAPGQLVSWQRPSA